MNTTMNTNTKKMTYLKVNSTDYKISEGSFKNMES